MTEFYEIDEPVDYVVAAFDRGTKGQTVNLDLGVQSYRDTVAENETLRQELAEAKRLNDELGKALDREHEFEKRHLSDLVDARAERDAAAMDAERCRLLLALHGDGVDPGGTYAGTPGTRLRSLLAAEAELADANKRIANLSAQCNRNTEQIGRLQREAAELDAERDGMREVVEAAKAWRAALLVVSDTGAEKRAWDELRSKNRQALCDAVDALATKDANHRYLSTACLHAVEPGREHLHRECQSDTTRYDGTHKIGASCKWCEAPCVCRCHVSTKDGA